MTDPTVQPQLDATLAAVDAALGPIVIGIYLYGSAVEGGLKPRSDLDLLVVTARATNLDEKLRLVAGLRAVSNRDEMPGFERPLELTIVTAPDMRPWRYPPTMDFQYGEWLRERFDRGELDPDKPQNPDLTILLTSVLGASVPLVGPPASDLIEPVPPADLRRAMTEELPWLLQDLATDTRNIVLTLARIWVTVSTGEIRTKDAAADWALERLPVEHRPVLARARAIYLGAENERWNDLAERLLPFSDHVVMAIRNA